MFVSVFDLFKIGIGPSSSHTIGPMRATERFAAGLGAAGLLDRVVRVQVTLYGSLAWTGKGHATDKAVLLGLAGQAPDRIDPDEVELILQTITEEGRLRLAGQKMIGFDAAADVVFDFETVEPRHSNALRCAALTADGHVLAERLYFSIGGGFVVDEDEMAAGASGAAAQTPVPYPFASGAELLDRAEVAGLSIAGLMRANETALRPAHEVDAHIARVAAVMSDCIDRGVRAEGMLPGSLKVRRRARGLMQKLSQGANAKPAHELFEWISLFAMAVNEENAAGGRVVTAPTNGAAGVVPAVLRYFRQFCPEYSEARVADFLLTAAAIGALFKLNASISGAEVGCQGEVGVACSMAAAGLTAALGGTNAQIENAAEIGMEHHLGMTCDPVGGLVQIPCIERNAMGAVKAINAASLALAGDGTHRVSLDQVIETMRQTGADMATKYKETSRGGLAVNVVEC